MSNFWVLSNIDLYAILCPVKLNYYHEKHGVRYGKESVIYSENKLDSNIYFVSKGKVKLVNYDTHGNEIVKQILTKGELFGEDIILDESQRTEYAISCTNRTTICSMSLNNMRTLMRENNLFSTTIYKLIGLKLKRVERRLELLIGKGVMPRVASFLYDLYLEKGALRFSYELSQKDMATLLALSRESMTKALFKLKKDGIIDYNRKEMHLLDLEALLELSER